MNLHKHFQWGPSIGKKGPYKDMEIVAFPIDYFSTEVAGQEEFHARSVPMHSLMPFTRYKLFSKEKGNATELKVIGIVRTPPAGNH